MQIGKHVRQEKIDDFRKEWRKVKNRRFQKRMEKSENLPENFRIRREWGALPSDSTSSLAMANYASVNSPLIDTFPAKNDTVQ
jgi:hypothetical protein